MDAHAARELVRLAWTELGAVLSDPADQRAHPRLAMAQQFLDRALAEAARAERLTQRADALEGLLKRVTALGWAGPAGDQPLDRSAGNALSFLATLEGAGGGETLADELIRELLAVELGEERVEDASPRTQSADDGELTPDDLTRYLGRRWPDRHVSATGVQYLEGGYSKHTIMVSVEEGGRPEALVFRMDRGVPEIKSDLGREFAVLQHVWEAGFLVPEPLWLEDDPSLLGGECIVMRRVAGVNVGDVFGSAEPVSPDLARQLARLMAELHTMGIEPLMGRLGPPVPAAQQHRGSIDGMEQRLSVLDKVPLMEGLLSWLRANVPNEPASVALVHGDIGFHNMLVQDGQVSAILDWEGAGLGDPAADLAYVRPSVEPSLAWEDFLDEYCAAGGSRPGEGAVRFFTVRQDTTRAMACLLLRGQFLKGSGRVPDAAAGYVHFPRFLRSALASAFAEPARRMA